MYAQQPLGTPVVRLQLCERDRPSAVQHPWARAEVDSIERQRLSGPHRRCAAEYPCPPLVDRRGTEPEEPAVVQALGVGLRAFATAFEYHDP